MLAKISLNIAHGRGGVGARRGATNHSDWKASPWLVSRLAPQVVSNSAKSRIGRQGDCQ